MKTHSSYVYAFTREADLRTRGEILDLDAYIIDRRDNAAIRPCFDLMEWALGFSLPDEVFEDDFTFGAAGSASVESKADR